MASSFVVTADLRLDPRSINSSAKQVKQALGRITGQASEFQKSLDASTARVFAFGATTTVLAGVSTAFRSLVKSTIDVEKRLVEINAIFQQSEAVMNSFRDAIFKVAQTTGQTFSTVADAAGELARQGLSAEETASRLQDALILTRISGLGAEDSVKTLTAAINGFTSAALTATQVTSKIVAVDTAFAVSAQDLAQGLARAGSTAEDAGVSFDQLLGLITAVEQRTARGGAVIGNAFKSIFTRLSRGSTIDDLRSLGVEIDASQTGVQKLQALSNALENIADPTVASKIKELAGGVFQINVVSATLKDLANDTGVFKKATQEAAQASDDAYKRNEQLNKSISAQINSLVVGLTNLAEKIGSVTFGPLLTNLIGVAGKITETFNNLLDPEQGNTVAKAFFKGIGAFISGPGLVLITAAFIKIVRLVAKFALDGFKAVLQIGSAAEKVKQIEGGIVQLLSQDENLRKVIASTTASQAQKEQAVINAIKAENSLLLQQESLVRSIANLAAKKGVTGFSSGGGFTTKGAKRFSGGYVPNFARSDFQLEEAEAKALGASSSVRAKMSKGKIGGKKFVMNSQETELPNFGRNGDSAVIPNYAKGYVPNFANFRLKDFGRFSGAQVGSRFGKGDKKFDSAAIAAGYKSTKQKKQQRIEDGPVNVRKIAGGLLPTILTPNPRDGGKITTTRKGTETLRPLVFDFPVKGFGRKKQLDIGNQFEKDFNAESLTQKAKQKALQYANSITNVLGSPNPATNKINDVDAIKGFTGAVRSAAGAIFDAALTTALNIKGGPTGEGKSPTGGDFDVRGKTAGLEKFFAGRVLPTKGAFSGLADFKFSAQGSTESMKKKTLSELSTKPAIFNKIRKAPLSNKGKGKAAGYIPNFAGGGDALSQAISREKAAGLPAHKIRVNQSNRLINSKNPTGLAITNTRDEPRGLRDVFASGYVPNFALSGGFAGFDQRTISAQKINELEKQLDSNAKANQKASKSARNSISGLDELTKETKSTNKFFKLQGAALASSFAISTIYVKVTDSANKKRQQQIDVTNKSLEAEKKSIEASDKSAEAKLKAIEYADKAAQAQIKNIEANRTATEKTLGFAQTASSAAFSLATLSGIGIGDGLKKLGSTDLGTLAQNKNGPPKLVIDGKEIKRAGVGLGKGTLNVLRNGAAGLGAAIGVGFVAYQAGTALENNDLNPVRFFAGLPQKSEEERRDKVQQAQDEKDQIKNSLSTNLARFIQEANPNIGKGIEVERIKVDQKEPLDQSTSAEKIGGTIGRFILGGLTGVGLKAGKNAVAPDRPKAKELVDAPKQNVTGQVLKNVKTAFPNIADSDLDVIRKVYDDYAKKASSGLNGVEYEKLNQKLKDFTSIIGKVSLDGAGIKKLQAQAKSEQEKINSSYLSIRKNSQLIANEQFAIANASKIAAERINTYASLVPDEFQEFAKAKALTETSTLGINQNKRTVESAKSTRDAAFEAQKGKPKDSDEAQAFRDATAEVAAAESELKNSVFSATANIIGALNETSEKIKSLGGPAFEEAFKGIEQLKNNFVTKPSEKNLDILKGALGEFAQQGGPLQKEIKLQRDDNASAGIGTLLSGITDLRTNGAPDLSSALLAAKEIKGTKAGSVEREDVLAKLAPLLESVRNSLGDDGIKLIAQQAGIDPEKFLGKGIIDTQVSAFKRDVKDDPTNVLDDKQINAAGELYRKKLEEAAKSAEKFPNTDQLQTEFDKLSSTTVILSDKLTDLADEFPDSKKLAAAIGGLTSKAENAGAAFDSLATIGEAIGGFAEGAEKAVKDAVSGVERLTLTNEKAALSIEGLEKNQEALAKTIKTLTALTTALAAGLGD